MTEQVTICDFSGHVWGKGQVTGLLVCCRKRCTAQAACVVCCAGGVPRGFYATTCPAHTPRAPFSEKRVKPALGSVESAPSQASLWSGGEDTR